MSRPGDGVGLTRSCAVLYQVLLPGPLGGGGAYKLSNHIPLVVTGKDKGLFFVFSTLIAFFIFNLEMDEAGQNVEKILRQEHLIPEVVRGITPDIGGDLVSGLRSCSGLNCTRRNLVPLSTRLFRSTPRVPKVRIVLSAAWGSAFSSCCTTRSRNFPSGSEGKSLESPLPVIALGRAQQPSLRNQIPDHIVLKNPLFCSCHT